MLKIRFRAFNAAAGAHQAQACRWCVVVHGSELGTSLNQLSVREKSVTALRLLSARSDERVGRRVERSLCINPPSHSWDPSQPDVPYSRAW